MDSRNWPEEDQAKLKALNQQRKRLSKIFLEQFDRKFNGRHKKIAPETSVTLTSQIDGSQVQLPKDGKWSLWIQPLEDVNHFGPSISLFLKNLRKSKNVKAGEAYLIVKSIALGPSSLPRPAYIMCCEGEWVRQEFAPKKIVTEPMA